MPEAALLRLSTVAVTAALQCGVALMTGALASRFWLRRSTSAWALTVGRRSRRWLVVGGLLTLAAHAVAGWLEAVAMVDEPSAAIGPMLLTVLRETHFGRVWLVGSVALLLALVAASRASAAAAAITALCIGTYALCRSVVSHAAAQGDFSAQVGVDGVHLLLVWLWVGMVLIGVLVVFRCPPRDRRDGLDALRWVVLLSRTATAALALIVVTGVVKVGWATPSWALLVASTYGRLLLAKLVLVGIAAGLGGFNRWHRMPSLLRALDDAGESPRWSNAGFARVLRLEAAVLACAVVAAALLSGTATPGEG